MAQPIADLVSTIYGAQPPTEEEGGIVALVLPVETYKQLSDKAAERGMSFNQLIITALSQVLKEDS